MGVNRNLGLDITRSIAIILVLICHFSCFYKGEYSSYMVYCGILGVELFFVLSGFLIGKIIINDLLKNSNIHSLK